MIEKIPERTKATLLHFLLIFALLSLSLQTHSAVPTEEAKKLLNELTPVGAIRSSNADNSIPEWTESIEENNQHLERIQTEAPLFTISAENIDEHIEFLSNGTQALMRTYPETFKLPIYKSYRTSKLPQWLYENAIRNASEAKINDTGTSVLYALPGIPFPIPQSAEEAMWNHILRWKGLFFKLDTIETTVTETGNYNIIDNTLEVYSIYHDRNVPQQQDDWRYLYYLSYINAPARLAGGAYLSYESMKPSEKPRQSWMYVAGQRRMRRSPVMGYDAPTFTSDGLRMMDEIDVFNGALDRYEWELVGRKEMYIPYNNRKLEVAIGQELNAVLTPHHIASDYTRYEKHRVWVIEAKLREGQEHVYARRTFYLDEDTWSILMVDIYNEEQQLWRVSTRYANYYNEVPVMLTSLDAYHDLLKRSYYIQSFPKGYNHSYTAPKKGYFSPNIVRQRLHR